MRHGFSLVAVGHASSLFLAITFSLCVAFDLLFPEMAMFQAWFKLNVIARNRLLAWPTRDVRERRQRTTHRGRGGSWKWTVY